MKHLSTLIAVKKLTIIQFTKIIQDLFYLDEFILDSLIIHLENCTIYHDESAIAFCIQYQNNDYEYNLTSKDLQILLCYALFPQMCLVHFHEDSLTKKRRRLVKYNKKLYSLILLLQKYIQIPSLKWIK